MADYYPPWGFYYKVEFGISQNKNDVSFQSVSGLSVEYDMEEYKEGGENRFVHQLPKPAKRNNIVLKRGLTDNTSGLVKWCKATLEGDFAKKIEKRVAELADEFGSGWWQARRNAYRNATPEPTGPEAGAWRRRWALGPKPGQRRSSSTDARRWPEL